MYMNNYFVHTKKQLLTYDKKNVWIREEIEKGGSLQVSCWREGTFLYNYTVYNNIFMSINLAVVIRYV